MQVDDQSLTWCLAKWREHEELWKWHKKLLDSNKYQSEKLTSGLSSTHLSKAEEIWELIEMNVISLFAGVSNGEAWVHLL